MDVREVAELLGVHTNTIYNRINNGLIKAKKRGKSWDIPVEEFECLKRQKGLTPRHVIQAMNLVDNWLSSRVDYLSGLVSIAILHNTWKHQAPEQEREVVEEVSKMMEGIKNYQNALKIIRFGKRRSI
ncbi:helix-turn-helix domain-containing protein [Brevibacillus daliensis]|uniref:helix-turn-helix domain-containing protein n=1 Tax=Brevibacillus daliensis TaxID=2892995 RepID=UPI001E574328|nr:helix-turn-helix domain-containing protein [Brevibacillus daliensis]